MASDLALRLLVLYYRTRFALVRPADFVLTGIPRSGTSLLSALLCEPEDCFCFNEIFYDPMTLPYFFAREKKRLILGEPVPVKMDADGSLTTDTMEGEIVVARKSFPPKRKGVIVGSNVNIPYLDRLDEILAYRYRVIALVRDPVYTLASWNSAKTEMLPEAHVMDDDMNPRWNGMRFDSTDRVGRQAEIWEHYARLILDLRDRVKIIRYESLCDGQQATLETIYQYLGVTPPPQTRDLKNMNVDSRFSGLDRIRAAVAERCLSRQVLGYH
ncbi:MAG: sulfotransferase [Acidobacteria bacterium]|nr:sulfotransferase [Acidobacteriota bacterium]